MLTNVEDTKALTSLVEAVAGGSVVRERILGEDRSADTTGLQHGKPCTAATGTTPEQLSTGGPCGIATERPPPFAGHVADCPHTHNPYDTEEETYVHWLNKNGQQIRDAKMLLC